MTAGGNQICLGVSGAHTGKIFLWDHEAEEEVEAGQAPRWNNVELLAASLGDLLAGLTDVPAT